MCCENSNPKNSSQRQCVKMNCHLLFVYFKKRFTSDILNDSKLSLHEEKNVEHHLRVNPAKQKKNETYEKLFIIVVKFTSYSKCISRQLHLILQLVNCSIHSKHTCQKCRRNFHCLREMAVNDFNTQFVI